MIETVPNTQATPADAGSRFRGWVHRRVAVARSVVPNAVLVALPLALYAILLADSARRGNFAIDFEQTLLPAAEKLSHGESPYPAYAYPPLVAFGLVPFAFVPAADVLFVAVLVFSVPLSLWLLGVRDWRCYPTAFLWAPTFHAVQTANVSILLLLGFAFCWRFRESPVALTVGGGLTIAAKIICWPLAVWLAATRRYRGAVGAVAASLVVTFGLWGSLGFSGLARYPSDIDRLSTQVSPDSYTIRALAGDLGAPATVGRALGFVLIAAALVLCVAAGRRGDDQRAYSFAVLAAIVASPIVWLHSFVLLLAVVAIFRPRLSWIWFAPVALWAASGNGNGTPWQTALVLGVATVVSGVCLIPLGRDREADHRTGTTSLSPDTAK